MPAPPRDLYDEKEPRGMSDSRFRTLVIAISFTTICLGMSYCSSKVDAPAPVLKLEVIPSNLRIVPNNNP